MTIRCHLLSAFLILAAPVAPASAEAPASPRVVVSRVPHGGVQPEVVVDRAGVIHLVYLAGTPAAADVFYTHSSDRGGTFATPVRVNSQPGSAIAVGTIRGAQLALDAEGRVHVVWNGSGSAEPKPPVRAGQKAGMPLLYARSAPGGARFEPQRNLMTATRHLDGGSSVAAGPDGAVLVAWHGNAIDGPEGEEARRVWLARSVDHGATFSAEVPISPVTTGVCGCCGLRMTASPHGVDVLYRAATAMIHRDVHALHSADGGRTFDAQAVDAWEIGACPMSSMAIVPGQTAIHAWEHDGQVAFRAGSAAATSPAAAAVPAPAERRKHPRLAVDAAGRVLMAWAVGTGWNKGGSVAWQVFADGVALGRIDTREGLAVWSFPAVVAVGDGFVVLY